MSTEAPMDVDPKLDAVLERRGFEVVLGLLQTAAGPGEGSVVHGLTSPGNQFGIPRTYVENWVRRQTEARHAQEVRDRRWMHVAAIAAIFAAAIAFAAAGIALIAWLFPIH